MVQGVPFGVARAKAAMNIIGRFGRSFNPSSQSGLQGASHRSNQGCRTVSGCRRLGHRAGSAFRQNAQGGYIKLKYAATVFPVAARDPASMKLHEFLADGQPESCSPVSPRVGAVAL
jgi:hypothetical protein